MYGCLFDNTIIIIIIRNSYITSIPIDLVLPKLLNYLSFQSFDFELPDEGYSRNVHVHRKEDIAKYLEYSDFVKPVIKLRMKSTLYWNVL
jgi:hypothetical protein